MNTFEIRPGLPEDLPALETLYPAAFPEEDLLPLVRDLLKEPEGVVSLVATDGPKLVGHIAFTLCGINGTNTWAALLAPLAVAPDHQRQGVGTAPGWIGCAAMASAPSWCSAIPPISAA